MCEKLWFYFIFYGKAKVLVFFSHQLNIQFKCSVFLQPLDFSALKKLLFTNALG